MFPLLCERRVFKSQCLLYQFGFTGKLQAFIWLLSFHQLPTVLLALPVSHGLFHVEGKLCTSGNWPRGSVITARQMWLLCRHADPAHFSSCLMQGDKVPNPLSSRELRTTVGGNQMVPWPTDPRRDFGGRVQNQKRPWVWVRQALLAFHFFEFLLPVRAEMDVQLGEWINWDLIKFLIF